jgi:hypothetical protein
MNGHKVIHASWYLRIASIVMLYACYGHPFVYFAFWNRAQKGDVRSSYLLFCGVIGLPLVTYACVRILANRFVIEEWGFTHRKFIHTRRYRFSHIHDFERVRGGFRVVFLDETAVTIMLAGTDPAYAFSEIQRHFQLWQENRTP